MFRIALGATLSILLPTVGFCQKPSYADTVPTSRFFELNEYFVQVPLGQTFIGPAHCSGLTIARYYLPADKPHPICDIDTTPQQHIRTSILMGSQPRGGFFQSQSALRGASNSIVSYQMSGSMTIDDDPAKYLVDLAVDPLAPVAMKMNLGYGSARLDLSDLRMMALEIVSGAADVVISYSKPNAVPMKYLSVSSGMSKIVIRNLESARAEQVNIENGMGDTKIVVGSTMTARSTVHIDVGAGKCTLLVHQDAPIKVVVNGTVFSSAQIPDGFVHTSDNTFTSHSYKVHTQEAMTVIVDLGLGSFEMIPFE
jgi:hypothetical protein